MKLLPIFLILALTVFTTFADEEDDDDHGHDDDGHDDDDDHGHDDDDDDDDDHDHDHDKTKPIPDHCIRGRKGKTFKDYTYKSKTIRFFFGECGRDDWSSAQEYCANQGSNGKLWEPRDPSEYKDVFKMLTKNGGKTYPKWWKDSEHFWIGAKADSGDSDKAHWATEPMGEAWKTLKEHNDDGCVDIYDEKKNWGDHNCSNHYHFICQFEEEARVSPSCHCSYGGKEYKCGAQVGLIPHACMELYCDKNGSIRSIDYFRGPKQCKCCKYGNKLYSAGHYIKMKKLYCCEGKFIKLESNPK